MSENIEIWADINGYGGRYQISNFGNVRRTMAWNPYWREYRTLKKPELLTPTGNGNGYLIIGFAQDGKRKNHYIHRLVAEAFLEKKDGADEVNHIDYNKLNNNVNNLEWCNRVENIHHSICNMHKRKPGKTNTGEYYITKRLKNGKWYYRITVDGKEKSASTMSAAIRIRESMLRGVTV